MNRRGSILIHVLITSVIVSVIAAGMMRMTLLRHTITERVSSGGKKRKIAEAEMNTIITYWNANGSCTNWPGHTCSPQNVCRASATSDCVCNPTATGGSVILAKWKTPTPPTMPRCELTITTP